MTRSAGIHRLVVAGVAIVVEDDLAIEIVVDGRVADCHSTHRSPTVREQNLRTPREWRTWLAPTSSRAPVNASADPAFWLLIGQLIMFTGVAAVFPIAPLYVAHRGGNSIAVAIFIAGPLVANTLVQVPGGTSLRSLGTQAVPGRSAARLRGARRSSCSSTSARCRCSPRSGSSWARAPAPTSRRCARRSPI